MAGAASSLLPFGVGFCDGVGVSVPPVQIPDYTLIRVIGRGSYGEVWLGRSVTGTYRAVKVVHRDRFDSARPFEREFAGIQRFERTSNRHPSQLRILHVGRLADDSAFHYVMELADPVGGDGGEIDPETYAPRTLRTERGGRGWLPVAEVLRLAGPLTEALEHLHAEGLVHRDIKPSNIIFVGGRPKLADIGLITAAEASQTFVGTEGFVPPEGPGTEAADLFALGKVLYEVATGCDRNRFPSLPGDLDERVDRAALMELNETWLKACDPDPSRRHGSAAQLRQELEELAAGSPMRRWRRVERRLRWVTGAGIVAALLAVGSTGMGYWANRERQRARAAEAELGRRFSEQQVALARAMRAGGRPGQRLESLAILDRVASREPGMAWPRERIAAMALPDVRRIGPLAPPGVRLVLSPDLGRFATNDADGRVHVIGSPGGGAETVLPVYLGEDGVAVPVVGHGFGPDPRFYGVSYWNRDFVVWDLERITAGAGSGIYRTFALPVGARQGMSVGPGLRMATDGRDGALHVFDALEGREVLTVPGCPDPRVIAVRPDGTRLAQWTGERIRIRDMADGTELQEWSTGSPVAGVVWHPDGVQLLAWSHDRYLRLWNSETGRPAGVLAGHDAAVVGACFDGSGAWLVSTGWDDQTLLWSVARQEAVLRLPLSGNGLRLSGDGRRIAVERWKDAAWTLAELVLPEVRHLEPHPASASMEGNRDLWRLAVLDNGLLVGGSNGGLNVWRPDAAGFGVFLRMPLRHALVAVPGGGVLTVDGRAAWRRRLGWKGPGHPLEVGTPERLTPATVGGVVHVVASRDGSRLAVVNDRGELHLQSADEDGAWRRWEAGPVHSCSLDAAATRLGAVLVGGGFEVWEVATGRSLLRVDGRGYLLGALSPDGRWWAAGDAGWMGVWDVRTGGLCHERPRTVRAGCNFAWATDGGHLVVQDEDGEALVLESGSWRTVHAVPAPPMMRLPVLTKEWLAMPGEKCGVDLWVRRDLEGVGEKR